MAEQAGTRETEGWETQFERLSVRASLPQVSETISALVREAIACGVAWGCEHASDVGDGQFLPRELELVAEALEKRWETQVEEILDLPDEECES